MKTVYLYVLETLADWEIGYVTAEVNSRRFFRAGAPEVKLVRVGAKREPVTTMGGMTVTPDAVVADIVAGPDSVLLLPGADTWSDPAHAAVVEKAGEVLDAGGVVAAICGATVALASAGMLDQRRHTSNGAGFLDMMAPGYAGAACYVDQPAVADGNLITAAGTGALAWTREVLRALDVLSPEALEVWFDYFATGSAASFFALMQMVGK